MNTLKDALVKAGMALTEEEIQAEEEQRETKQRIKQFRERPKEEVELKSIADCPFQSKKFQSDPTEDLIALPNGMLEAERKEILPGEYQFAIWCEDTKEMWLAPTRLCLDQNFIYRKDLLIFELDDTWESFNEIYMKYAGKYRPGITSRKSCYILDNPANETYEVYYDPTYPSATYGKATPNGMFVHKYDNRFKRDMIIMELDDLYSHSSRKAAAKLSKSKMKASEAIVVSDGCFMKDVCSSAHYYLDNSSLVKLTQGFVPTEPDQAVLISEIVGATNALLMCYMKKKKRITYYYDNTSILNVFRNRKTEYIEEIKAYKELLEKMDAEGYQVTFMELHPKTGEEREKANPALMFFHNYCDKECRDMTDVFTKSYKDMVDTNEGTGKTYSQVKNEFRANSKVGHSSGNGVRNNSRNGNNKYVKRF